MKQIVAKPFTEEEHKAFKRVCLDSDVSMVGAVQLFVRKMIASGGSVIKQYQKGDSGDEPIVLGTNDKE